MIKNWISKRVNVRVNIVIHKISNKNSNYRFDKYKKRIKLNFLNKLYV